MSRPSGSGRVSDTPARIVIVDDSAEFRQLLRLLVRTVDTLEVVAEAADGAAGVVVVEEHTPDVVVTDLQMPGVNGLDLVRTLRGRDFAMPILMLTSFPTPEVIDEATEAGVTMFMEKGSDLATRLPATLRELAALAVVR